MEDNMIIFKLVNISISRSNCYNLSWLEDRWNLLKFKLWDVINWIYYPKRCVNCSNWLLTADIKDWRYYKFGITEDRYGICLAREDPEEEYHDWKCKNDHCSLWLRK